MSRCSKRVSQAIKDQGGPATNLQEKIQEIVMEKVADAVQKKAEEVQQADHRTEEKKEIL